MCWLVKVADLCDKRQDFKSNLANYKSLCTLRLWRDKHSLRGGLVDRGKRNKRKKSTFRKKNHFYSPNERMTMKWLLHVISFELSRRSASNPTYTWSIRFISCPLFWIKCWNVNYVLTLWTKNDHVIIPSRSNRTFERSEWTQPGNGRRTGEKRFRCCYLIFLVSNFGRSVSVSLACYYIGGSIEYCRLAVSPELHATQWHCFYRCIVTGMDTHGRPIAFGFNQFGQ